MRIAALFNNPIVSYGTVALLGANIAAAVDAVYPVNGWVKAAIAISGIAGLYLATTFCKNVHHNPNLTDLNLSNTQPAQTPDVSHNPNLTDLNLSNTEL